MSLDVVDLDPVRDADAIKRFSRIVWPGTRGDAYWDWLLSTPRLTGALAKGPDGELRALVLALRRDYVLSGEPVECLETFDWFCLPSDVGSGLGVFVMKRLLRTRQPVVALGAMPEAQSLLKRLGFRELASGWGLWKPLRGAALRARGWSPVLTTGFDLVQAAQRVIARRASRATISPIGAGAAGLAMVDGFGRVDREFVSWLQSSPPVVGQFERVDWPSRRGAASAIVRRWRARDLHHAEVLDLRASEDIPYDEMLKEVVDLLHRRRCDLVQVTTTHASLEQSARACGFRLADRPPLLVFGADPRLDHLLEVNGLRGDGPFSGTALT